MSKKHKRIKKERGEKSNKFGFTLSEDK